MIMIIRTKIASQADRSGRTRRTVSLCGWWAGLVAIVLVLLPIPAHTESGPAAPQTLVRGEIVMLTTELVVVKSIEGTSILIPLGKNTKLDPMLKVGDRAEVVVTSDNHVSSVRMLTPEPLP